MGDRALRKGEETIGICFLRNLVFKERQRPSSNLMGQWADRNLGFDFLPIRSNGRCGPIHAKLTAVSVVCDLATFGADIWSSRLA
jgi:hypothetical protein